MVSDCFHVNEACRRAVAMMTDVGRLLDWGWVGRMKLVVESIPSRSSNQYRPQSFKLFLIMTSVTASNTNWILFVSVAHVK
jgi:hypothetical protein